MSGAEGWKPKGPNEKRVEIGKFDEKGLTIKPVSDKEMTDIHRANAQDILKRAGERGSWIKDWDEETRKRFVDAYIALMTGVNKVARKFPEGTPPANLMFGKWGEAPFVDWKWIDPPSSLGARPAIRIKK